MKRVIFACFVYLFSIPFAFAQEVEKHLNSGYYLKRIENNMRDAVGNYNMKSKSDIEKLFFGDFNALIEFCYNPSSEVNPCVPSGFRIFRDSLTSSYVLEVKRILNYREAAEEATKEVKNEQKRQELYIPTSLFDSLPRNVFNQVWEYNQGIYDQNVYYENYYKALPKHFNVEIKSITISSQFAEKLSKMMVSFIDNFKSKGIPLSNTDGYSVSFRTVVDYDLWSLSIHMPGGNANTMANFCMEIIKDANEDNFEESRLLDFKDF
ncbi:MAG: hypothetical protein ACK5HT_08715 [Draconibacterium sp.]